MGLVIGKPIAQKGSAGIDTDRLRGALLPINATPKIVNRAPDAPDATAYSFQYHSIGGRKPLVWTIQSGTQPTGLTLSTDGVLSGTTAGAGTFTFTVAATDDAGIVATLAESVTIT